MLRWTALAALLVAAAIAWFWHYRVDDEIRARFEARLAAGYPQLRVRVESGRRIAGKGLEFRGVRIWDPQIQGAEGLLAHIDEVFVSCRTGAQDLLHEDLGITQVVLRRATIFNRRRADGEWTAARLLPLPKLGDDTPEVLIESGRLELIDPSRGAKARLAMEQIQLRLAPAPLGDWAERGLVSPASSGDVRRVVTRIEGRLGGSYLQQAALAGWIDDASGAWSVWGNVAGLRLSRSLYQSLPGDLAAPLAELFSVSGEVACEFRAARGDSGERPLEFQVAGELSGGRIDHAALPYPLTDVKAVFALDPRRARVERLEGFSGPAALTASFERFGYAADSPMQVKARARRVPLDRNLADSLPVLLRSAWYQFMPDGVVDLDVEAEYDGVSWRPRGTVRCIDVSFAYHAAPYRLERCTGTIHFGEERLTLSLLAQGSGAPIRIEGNLTDPGQDAVGWIEVRSEAPVPIDERLLSSLGATSQGVVRSFRPRGSVAFRLRVERDRPQADFQRSLSVRLHDCAIQYEKFPYPIRQISGNLEMVDDRWTFRDVEGRNDSAYITANGHWLPHRDHGGALRLDLVVTDLPLEDELRDALPPHVQRVWNGLRPRGTIDHAAIGLAYDTESAEFDIDIRAQKWPERQNIEGRTLALFPVWFPYELEGVTGAARYSGGRVEFQDVQAAHGAVRLAARGECRFSAEGDWLLRLAEIRADRFELDRDLLAALPPQLAQPLSRLTIRGPLGMAGQMEFWGGAHLGPQPNARWDLALHVENGSLSAGVELEHLFGEVRLTGGSEGGRTISRGEMYIDSLIFKGIQFTHVQGPLLIEPQRVLFGSWAEQNQPDRAPRQVTGRLFGGTVRGDAQIDLHDDMPFALQAALTGADLSRVTQETTRRAESISGMVHGVIQLSGTGKGTHMLKGGGRVRLRDADVYELPVMVALLKVLSVKRPDKTAFTTADIDYRVDGEHIYVERIDFKGDAISLIGNGEVDFRRNVALNFYTTMGRDEWQIPILRPMLGEASRQILMIRVTGTLDDPQTHREPFPVISETLQQLFADESRRTVPQPSWIPAPREVLDRGRNLLRR